jgi:hypothetical protein
MLLHEQQIKFAGRVKFKVGGSSERSNSITDAREPKQSQREKTSWAHWLTQYLEHSGNKRTVSYKEKLQRKVLKLLGTQKEIYKNGKYFVRLLQNVMKFKGFGGYYSRADQETKAHLLWGSGAGARVCAGWPERRDKEQAQKNRK